MRAARGILSAALLASAAVGTLILATDTWLWFSSPTHAYGLAAFVAIDIALVASMWRRTRFVIGGAMMAAAIQLIAMLGDTVAGEPAGVPSNAFRSYLLTNTAFLALLAIQSVIIVLGIGTLAIPLVHRHSLTFLRAKQR